ncbi:MAG: hypothetical protein Q8K82_15255, partial [Gemmatimonadaceae bacterium]|nr:hypothetical protein [Gemmatimonadaceae bacterium]
MPAFLESIGYNGWVLTALLVIPVLGALLLWAHSLTVNAATGAALERAEHTARLLTLAVLTLEFVVSVGLWWSLDVSSSGWQAGVDLPWIESWGARFSLGVDGLSLMMVLLTTVLMPLAVLGGW